MTGPPPPPGAAPGTLPPPPPRVGGAALAAGAANLFGRVSGLLREMVFAAFFGAGVAADAFNAAFRVPNLFRELLAEGSLSNVVVPMFAESLHKDGKEQAWALMNAILGLLLVVLGGLTVLMIVLAEPFVLLVASGFRDVDGKVALATELTRWLAPFLAGLSVASLFAGMLNVQGRFFLPALAPSALNVFIIAACLLGEPWEAATGWSPIALVALASTLSGFATVAIQFPALRRLGYRFRPHLRGHPGIARILRFMGAALVGIGVVQFNLLVETQFASSFGNGPVSWLIYGFRLVQLPQTVVSSSVAVAALATLSALLARGEREGARDALSHGLELNSLLVVPSAVGLYLLAHPLIAVFYERGAFSPADTVATAGVLRMYALATVGICTYRVLLPVFFALQDPYLPMRLSLAVMAAKLPLCWGLTRVMGVDGLPFSHALTVTFEVVIMTAVLGRRLGGFAPGFWSQHLRIAVAATVMGGAVLWLRPWADGLGVFAVSAAGGVVYGLLALVLGVRETRTLMARVLRKLRRLPPPPPGGLPPGAPPEPPPRPPR